MNLLLKKVLIVSHPLTNFETQRYYQNESRFNGVYSRNNSPKKIKDGAYIINLDEYADVGAHWIALQIKILKLLIWTVLGLNMFLEKFIGHKNIKKKHI